MVDIEQAPEVVEDTEAEARIRSNELRVLLTRFPEKAGQIRRIHPLWSGYYRINYHETEKCNAIGESHFVRLRNSQIVEDARG